MFEIIVQRSVFMKALSHVQSVVERKNTLAILSHMKLQAEDGKLIMTATDMNLSVAETIAAEITQQGSITLPAITLYEIVRKFSDETIELKIDETQPTMVQIQAGYSVFHLPFLNAEEFPKIDAGSFDCEFTIAHNLMQKIIEKNRNTVAQEDVRHNFNGIYLHPITANNELRATATDGHRLSSVRIALPEGAANMPAVIIPRKTIFELSKILSDDGSDVKLEVSAMKIRLTIGKVTLISKLIDAPFPDYLPLIPYNNSLFFNLPNVEFAKAVDRATTIMLEKSKAIKLTITGNQLELSVGGDHSSLANEKLEVNCNTEQFEISINAKYLLDISSAIGNNSNIEFKLSDPYSAVLVQSQDDDKTEFVVMPMRG